MADVKSEFTATCGDLVTYCTYEIKGRLLRVQYFVDGAPKEPRWVEINLMNTSDREVGEKASLAGRLAAQKAYAASGKRDADIAASLKGKIVR